jgi:hypothetical protein
VVDVMALAFNRSALQIDNFRDSMKYVAPIAKSANITVEQTTALLGTLADAGIRGSQAGTGLRRVITDLAKDGRPLAARLKELADRGLTFGGAMDEVGRFAQAALLVLTQTTGKTEALEDALNNAAGTGAKAAEIIGTNLEGSLKKATSANEGLILSFSEGAGPLRDIVDAYTAIVTASTTLIQSQSIIGKLFKNIADNLTLPIRALGFLADKFNQTNEVLEDTDAKLKAIENTVKAAFDSGDVEAYIRALDQNIYKEEIIAAIRLRQGQLILEQVDAQQKHRKTLEELHAELDLLNTQFKTQTDINDLKSLQNTALKIQAKQAEIKVIEDLLKVQENLNFALQTEFATQQLINAEAGKRTRITDPQFTKVDSPVSGDSFRTIDVFEFAAPDTSALLESLDSVSSAVAATGLEFDNLNETVEDNIGQIIARHEAMVAQQQRVADTARFVGDAFGDMVGSIVSGQQSVLQAIIKTTLKLLPVLLARANAGVIAGAAETTAPPPVILALAAAGLAGISALFSSATGFSGGGGSAGSAKQVTNVSNRNPTTGFGESIQVDANFRIQGQDLVAVASSQANRDNRLG